MDREVMEFDVVVVGAGPAGLTAAIRLKQKAPDLNICVLDKAAEIGGHSLSGCVFEPRALEELLPDWRDRQAPLSCAVTSEQFVYLTAAHTVPLPTPPQMNNHGNYIISLGEFCRWLAAQAEEMGVEVYPGFAAVAVLYDDNGGVRGVLTGDMGRNADGSEGPNFTAGMELVGRQTLFAEGCRGSLTLDLEERFNLRRDCDPQTYGLGIKEIWEVRPDHHREGTVWHSVGWPLDSATYGGGFVYHLPDHQVAVGFVVGLDYTNPTLSPFEEMQRFKTHPAVAKILHEGRRIAYGARTLSEGGVQSLPHLTFPGGVLIGDCAGFLNVPKIKGVHTAMKSALLAADAVAELLTVSTAEDRQASAYEGQVRQSWLWDELWRERNIRPGFRYGLWVGIALSAVETYILRGRSPWTLHHHGDHKALKPVQNCRPITYAKPDGILTFDRLSSVWLANLSHEEDQPCHLRLRDDAVPMTVNRPLYGLPEQVYCPAGVYEAGSADGNPHLVINAANCLHCKACSIKDPTQNIVWTPPQGGSGPNYARM